jgi:hypothetical protein
MTNAKRRRLGLDGDDPDLESLLKPRDILDRMPVGAEPPTEAKSDQEGSAEPQGASLVRRSGEGGPR